MLNTAVESRHAVYRDAASLLQTRRALFAGKPDQPEHLLSETAITPQDDHTLLELLVLFRFITALENFHGTDAQFETITTDRQEVARLDGASGTEKEYNPLSTIFIRIQSSCWGWHFCSPLFVNSGDCARIFYLRSNSLRKSRTPCPVIAGLQVVTLDEKIKQRAQKCQRRFGRRLIIEVSEEVFNRS
jgi:hypothetical protein